MMAKATIKWMKEQDYYKYWILPFNDLHIAQPDLFAYVGCPVGNSPENMPWDTKLNRDLHEAVLRHVSMTFQLDKKCPEKFDMSTPK